MSLLRHHAVLLAQSELVDTLLVGRAFRVRPNDGDPLPDGQQRWWVVVDLAREGQGVVAAVLSTSFDGVAWYPVATVTTKRQAAVVDVVELDAFAPLVRVEMVGGPILPPYRVTARLASDGPFAVVPA